MQTRAVPLKHIRPSLSLVAATWLVLLAGCAGQEQYQQGAKLMTSGDQEKAVTALRQAVAADPANSEYQMKLADAETAAAEAHIRSAESLLGQNQQAEARAELVRALDLMPAHPRATTLLAQIDTAAQPTAAASPALVEAARPAPAAASPIDPTPAEVTSTPEPPAVAMHSEVQPASAAAALQANRPTPAAPLSPQAPASAPVIFSDPPPAPVTASAQPAAAALPGSPARAATPIESAQLPSQAVPAPALMPAAFRGVISRDDKHYPKELSALDGIVIKLKDTHDHPPRADIEIAVEKTHKRYDKLRVGMRVNGRGVSRSTYRLIVLAINPDTETVAFSIEPIRDQVRPAPAQR